MVTLIQELVQAMLHFDVEDWSERLNREVEAGAVTYIVGRSCSTDTNGSAVYLAALESDDPEVIRDHPTETIGQVRK